MSERGALDRRIVRTQRALRAALVALERGWDGVTVQEEELLLSGR